MLKKTDSTDIAGQYDEAYATQYTNHAEYARAQAVNIASSVVPRQELLDAHIDMALALLDDKSTVFVTRRPSETAPLDTLHSGTLMPTDTALFATPNFVLLNGKGRFGPEVATLSSGRSCTAFYGFSSRSRYDTFQANCELALKPYPLVKVFLRNEHDAAGDDLKLVVLEPTQPDQRQLHAALIRTVLDARESREVQVSPDYTLELDTEAGVYRVSEEST